MPQLQPSNNKSPHLPQLGPGLRNLEREQHATWIELFFDLVFVVAIAELSHYLEEHLTVIGFLQFVLLFVPSWWAWVLFTFYSDRFDTDDSIHRLLMLTGMLTILFLGANVHNAFGEGSAGFTLAYVLARSVVLALYYRASRHVPVARASVKLYLASYIPSTCLWLISIFVPEPLRYGLWVIAIAIELSIPIVGSRILAGTPSHPSHLPERFGLFTLIVLGEAIVSVATATTNIDWRLPSIMAAVGGFAIAACLWWLYFNFLENSVIIRDIRSVHIYNYGHLPILMGLTLVAVGIEHTISEANHHALSVATRWTLCGGLALYVFAIIVVWVLGCHRRVKWLSVSMIAISLGLAIIGGSLPPLVLEGCLVAMLVSKVSLGILRARKTAQLVAEDAEIIETQL
ncbi:low temperature requirement protein A [Nostoc sp. 106C]|uniref:low temperature requirement protein A n=1 Tax=Nostoc sp. 106C TaxID=1932667 RepID=UPI000A3CAAD6|nr:low temperature requirement protein A [Nostoc sp. 106C]